MDWRSGPIPQVFRAAYVCPLTGHPVNRIGFPAVFRDKGRASAGTVSSEREREPIVPNVNVTYADMQSAANQLRAGQQQIDERSGQAQEPDRQPGRERVRHGLFQQAVRGVLRRVQLGRHEDDRRASRAWASTWTRPRGRSRRRTPSSPLPSSNARDRGRPACAAARCRRAARSVIAGYRTEGTIMRLALTVASPATRRTADVVLEADPATPVADIAAELQRFISAASLAWPRPGRQCPAVGAGTAVSRLRARRARSPCPPQCRQRPGCPSRCT